MRDRNGRKKAFSLHFHIPWDREIMGGFLLNLSLLDSVRESVDLIKPY